MEEKSTTPPKTADFAGQIFGTFFKKTTDDGTKYIARFSKAYQPKSHEFHPAFKVLRGGYRDRHALLTTADINVYQELQYLCESDTAFTQEELATSCGTTAKTLRIHLDNLVNAELLEILTITDAPGQPFFYLLRSPLYEKLTFNQNTKKKISKNNESLPKVFLEDEAARLREQIEKNLSGIYRAVRRKDDLTDEERAIKTDFADRRLAIYRVFKSLVRRIPGKGGEPDRLDYTDAVNFNNLVWQLTREMPDIRGTEYWNIFRRKFKALLEGIGLKFTSWLLDLAVELGAFYDTRVRKIGTKPDTKPASPAPSAPPDEDFARATDGEDEKERVRKHIGKVFNAVKLGNSFGGFHPQTPGDFANWLKSYLNIKLFSVAELTALVQEFFPNEKGLKICDQLRE